MISTVHDLLVMLVEHHVPILDAETVKHPSTIGDMYEGLTEQLLGSAIPFNGVDVVTGFAEDNKGILSPQMDCMVVLGQGRSVPFTSARVFPLEQVVAIVEVKKTLYADDIADGYDKCRDVAKMIPGEANIRPDTVRGMFQGITRRVLPNEPATLSDPWKMFYHCLLMEAALPARIVLGYHGYRKMKDFRGAVAAELEKRVLRPGVGPVALPTLIMNDRHAIVKNDGLPYTAPIKDGIWPLLLSSTAHPLRVLLEVLWTRLTIRLGEPPELFGEDLEQELCDRFLDYELDPTGKGWHVTHIGNYQSSRNRSAQTWEPVSLTRAEYVLFEVFCDCIDIDVGDLPDMPDMAGLEAALDGLQAKGLVGPNGSTSRAFGLLMKKPGTAFLGSGYVAGENVSGQFDRWLSKRTQK